METTVLEIVAPAFELEKISAQEAAALKQLAEGQSLPGVRHWREAKTVVR